MGLTPLEYMEKMTDYTTDNKHVNLIKVSVSRIYFFVWMRRFSFSEKANVQ